MSVEFTGIELTTAALRHTLLRSSIIIIIRHQEIDNSAIYGNNDEISLGTQNGD